MRILFVIIFFPIVLLGALWELMVTYFNAGRTWARWP